MKWVYLDGGQSCGNAVGSSVKGGLRRFFLGVYLNEFGLDGGSF